MQQVSLAPMRHLSWAIRLLILKDLLRFFVLCILSIHVLPVPFICWTQKVRKL